MRVVMVVVALMCVLTSSAEASERVFRYGPIDLTGYETGRGNAPVQAPQVDGFVTGMHARIVDAAGQPVPQQRVMLHHVLFTNRGRFPGDRRSTDCKANVAHEKFYGTGEEDQALVLPPGYGYRLRAKDTWRLSWMFMNHTAAEERVYLEYRVTLADAPVTPVTPYWVSIACGKGKTFNVPGGGAAGSMFARSRTWRVPQSGRIVAGAAHAHGGVLGIGLADDVCGGRTILTSEARYGQADDPIYQLFPALHEPSPRSMSFVTSGAGWPVSKGDAIRVVSRYDGERPHGSVMAIMHVYVAAGPPRAAPCPPPPTDVQTHRLEFPGAPGRAQPPPVAIQLSTRDANGVAQPLATLPGPLRVLKGDVTVRVRGAAYTPRKLSVPAGAKVRWRFDDALEHDVTFAAGPRALGSRYLKDGGTYSREFVVPGEYRLFCSLHPLDMAQIVQVRPAG